MRFDDNDLLYANKLPMLFRRDQIQDMVGTKIIRTHQDWLVELATLKTFLVKEDENFVCHPIRTHEKLRYREIYIIVDLEPEFIPDIDTKPGAKVKPTWYNLGLYFYFPKAGKIFVVAVHNCWEAFIKPQQVKIASWFKHYLSKHPELNEVFLPLYLKPASNLVGAPLGSMTHADVQKIHENSADYTTGFIYDEPEY
jgi:hypothetical protein